VTSRKPDVTNDVQSGPPEARHTTPQRDEHTGKPAPHRPNQDEPYVHMKLPHERDESAEQDTSIEHGGEGRPVIDQAATDVESGQRDTDCYKATVPRVREHERKGR
jgi:hypothetical protein